MNVFSFCSPKNLPEEAKLRKTSSRQVSADLFTEYKLASSVVMKLKLIMLELPADCSVVIIGFLSSKWK